MYPFQYLKNFYKFLINTHIVYAFVLFSADIILSQNMKDIEKLRKEYEDFEQKSSQGKSVFSVEENQNNENNLPEKALIAPVKINDNLLKRIDKHFGYNFFTRNDSLKFWENLPTPNNYVLGPGDEIIITIWGETQLRQNYTITREGNIYDSKIGLLNVSGKTINELLDYLSLQFGRIYSTLSKKVPSSYIDISIGNLKSINVDFIGFVKYPGVYPIHPFSNIITGLIQIGGVDTTGSLRHVKIKRINKDDLEIDLYDYLLKGEFSNNIQLRDKDIVIIPPRKSFVEIDSAVVRPGIYESKEGESVFELINIAGGASNYFSDKISINRLNIPKISTPLTMHLDLDESKKIKILSGDKIILKKSFEVKNQVEILGQVKSPGIYNYVENMTLKQLLDLSSGFDDSTFVKSVYPQRLQIIRKNPNSIYDNVLYSALPFLGDEFIDMPLQNLDRIVIHPNLNFLEKKYVKIKGQVNIPGNYPIIQNNETLNSIINRAGGFTEKAFSKGIEVYRDSLRVAWQNLSLVIQPGDSIIVNERPGTILVSGEVYNPGLIEFDKKKSIRDYIDLAGGVTNLGDEKNVIVIYANGEVVPYKRFRKPTIEDGSNIIVNEKENTDPFNPNEFANTTLSLLSSIFTIIVLSQQINN